MEWINSIIRYKTFNEQEEKDKKIILKCIKTFEDILTRNNEIVHMTSSAFVINKKRDKVLMIHHNIYNSWSWTGGHCDGDADLLKVAIKELEEETGVTDIKVIVPNIFSLDVLQVKSHIKKGKYVAPHLHLSSAYLLEANEEQELVVKEDENSGVKWIELDKLEEYTINEPHMQKLYSKFIEKINLIDIGYFLK
ncbi:NUDIX hydrolase [Clostridium gasigenes]|uniref:ADP-ribose pyrophosphatase YjhB, NUDIX family n=1 Tax=Clostridium gasigenes TaxID=94869 RepID=A0A1H0QF69_9CLOT|nr:NUDIX hydrolase [Clostridium gasigenes]SDP15369.1 ADP-ribose pyrophosphatase YjhB, NUDIX family [Clostridium gasigenes]